MNAPTLFDAGQPAPRKDGAPTAIGAGVKVPNRSTEHIPQHLEPRAHHKAPAGTSEVAARQVKASAAKQRAEVFAVIVRAGAHGATDAEIELATGIRAQSVSPRRGELRKKGLIVDSGRRRETPRGRPAAVWVARVATGGAR